MSHIIVVGLVSSLVVDDVGDCDVSMYEFLLFFQVDESHFSLTLSLSTYFTWIDDRVIDTQQETGGENGAPHPHILMNDKISSFLWTPRIEILHLKNMNLPKRVLKNEEAIGLMYIASGID